jgi:hypothetical protein
LELPRLKSSLLKIIKALFLELQQPLRQIYSASLQKPRLLLTLDLSSDNLQLVILLAYLEVKKLITNHLLLSSELPRSLKNLQLRSLEDLMLQLLLISLQDRSSEIPQLLQALQFLEEMPLPLRKPKRKSMSLSHPFLAQTQSPQSQLTHYLEHLLLQVLYLVHQPRHLSPLGNHQLLLVALATKIKLKKRKPTTMKMTQRRGTRRVLK